MQKTTPRRPLNESEGFGHIEAYYQSGLRPSEYYHNHGLSEWQFYQWRKRYLSKQSPLAGSAAREKKFHRITIQPEVSSLPEASVSSVLEIHYPHGVKIVLGNGSGLDFDTVSALLKLRD